MGLPNNVVNMANDDPREWSQGIGGYDCQFFETIRQEYEDIYFAAGRVVGHPIDSMFLAYGRNAEEAKMLLLRPDEMAAIAWCATGALYNVELRSHLKVTEDKD